MGPLWLCWNAMTPGPEMPFWGRTGEAMTVCSFEVLSLSADDTIRLGKLLGAFLVPGDLVALAGEPGSGKTWLTKGIALGMGVNPKVVVTSPSFSLVNEYEGRFLLCHMDIYRLDTLEDFFASGLEEYFFLDAVVVMEWANRWPRVLPENSVTVKISIPTEGSRDIFFSGGGGRAFRIVEMLKQKVDEEKGWG